MDLTGLWSGLSAIGGALAGGLIPEWLKQRSERRADQRRNHAAKLELYAEYLFLMDQYGTDAPRAAHVEHRARTQLLAKRLLLTERDAKTRELLEAVVQSFPAEWDQVGFNEYEMLLSAIPHVWPPYEKAKDALMERIRETSPR